MGLDPTSFRTWAVFLTRCALLVQQGPGPCFFRNTRSDNGVGADRLGTSSQAVPKPFFCSSDLLQNDKFHSMSRRIRLCPKRRKKRF